MTSCHRTLTKELEISTGAGRQTMMSAPYLPQAGQASARTSSPGRLVTRQLAGAGRPTARLLASGVACMVALAVPADMAVLTVAEFAPFFGEEPAHLR